MSLKRMGRWAPATVMASALLLAACANIDLNTFGQGRLNPFTSDANVFQKKQQEVVRAAGPDDLIGADGRCSAGANAAAVASAEPGAAPPAGPSRGVGLGVFECDVVNRLGPTEKFEVGTNERGQRSALLTYTGGERPGIYRFTSGVLVSVERSPEPPSPPKPVKQKQPVKKRTT